MKPFTPSLTLKVVLKPETPDLPFFYVELCMEYGVEEPKKKDVWMAQRAAAKLPCDYVTTTDIQRALHPPEKQDVGRG